MKNIKQAYYYAFYILYKRGQKSATIFSYDFIASLYLIIIEICLFISFTNYYNLIFHTDSGIFRNEILITIVILLTVFDYIIFHYKDQWKHIIKEFDKFPDEKNIKYKRIVYSIILLIIANFILSFYLLFSQAKENQTGPYAPEFIEKKKMEDSLQKAKQIENLKKIYGEEKK